MASERTAAAEYSRWLEQGPKYAHAAAHFGMYALRPVSGTANAEPGVMPYTGQSVYLEAHVQDPAVYRAEDDQASTLLFGDMGPEWVFRCVLPLLTVVLGAGSVAADRQRGTLRLNLLYSRSALRLLAGRIVAVAFFPALIAIFTMGVLLAAALAFHMPEPAHAGLRWLVLAAVAVWSSVFWSVLAVTISTRFQRADSAFAVTLMLWLVVSVLLPRLSVQAAQSLFRFRRVRSCPQTSVKLRARMSRRSSNKRSLRTRSGATVCSENRSCR